MTNSVAFVVSALDLVCAVSIVYWLAADHWLKTICKMYRLAMWVLSAGLLYRAMAVCTFSGAGLGGPTSLLFEGAVWLAVTTHAVEIALSRTGKGSLS